MKVTFSRNMNGDVLVLVDDKVVALAKECEGYDYLKAHILAFATPPNDAEVEAWMHVANEWADGTCNAVQWIKNIRDGISTPAEALTDMTAQIEHCRSVSAAAKRNGDRT